MRKRNLLQLLALSTAFALFFSNCAVLPSCPNQLMPIIEVQVNNTASTHDDYINTTAFTPCRARILNVRTVFGNNLNYPGGVEIEIRNIPLATALTVSTTSSGGSASFFNTLPGDGSWFNFFIRGNSASTVDKSAIIEVATAGASCNEVVLSRTGLMVPSGASPIPTAATQRIEVEVGGTSHLDDYITWSPTVCRIKWANPPTASSTLNVTLRNISGADRIRFSNTSPPAATTATSATINVALTGDSTLNFYIAGNPTGASVNDKDAIIEVVETSSGNLLSRLGLMVRIRKNVNSLTTAERDRYLQALRDVHQTYNFFMLFRNSHSRNGAGFANIGHRQAHIGSAFLPWHRAFMVHFERLIESSDPSVALPYWHFDQSSPGMFNANFIGANPTTTTTNQVTLNAANPISTWTIPGEIVGIRRRTPYGDAGTPGSVTTTTTPVATETATLALGTSYVNFKGMEGTTHNGAHNNSGNTISWIAGSPAIAPQDPLFYFLHCNIDRLWAKWQWLNNRYDGAQATSYDLQGSHAAPAAGVLTPIYTENVQGRITSNRTLGQYVDDSLWPWDNVTGTAGGTTITAERPTVAPLTPFPIVPGGLMPGSRPNVKGTIDFRVINFAFDDFTPF